MAREVGGALTRNPLARPAGLEGVRTEDLVAEIDARLGTGHLVDKLHTADWLTRLAMRIEVRTDRFDNRLSCSNLVGQMAWLLSHPHWSLATLRDSEFLELGCGNLNPYARCIAAIAVGARRAVAIDLDAIGEPFVAARAALQALQWLHTDPEAILPGLGLSPEIVGPRFAGVDMRRLAIGDPAGLPAELVAYENRDVSRLAHADASVGASLSSAFLEHVPDLDQTLREMARVTRRGGIGTHNIDASDHRAYSDEATHPLEFLTVESNEALVAGSNRLRIFEIHAAFEANGFQVVGTMPHTRTDVPPDIRRRLAPRFRAMTDAQLGTIGVMFQVVRRC